jgi:alternate F1F0 ATPase F1 subunit epsilon
VTALVPTICTIHKSHGGDIFVALNAGVLVAEKGQVRIATREAHFGEDLDGMRRELISRFRQISEEEERARLALSKMELVAIRKLLTLEEDPFSYA